MNRTALARTYALVGMILFILKTLAASFSFVIIRLDLLLPIPGIKLSPIHRFIAIDTQILLRFRHLLGKLRSLKKYSFHAATVSGQKLAHYTDVRTDLNAPSTGPLKYPYLGQILTII